MTKIMIFFEEDKLDRLYYLNCLFFTIVRDFQRSFMYKKYDLFLGTRFMSVSRRTSNYVLYDTIDICFKKKGISLNLSLL